VPFELSLYGGGFDDYTFFSLFKTICFQPNPGSVAEEFSKKQQKSSYQNYFVQADFSLSETSFRNGFGVYIIRYSLRDLLRRQFQT
jgi:iron complex outermembrane receptor protein